MAQRSDGSIVSHMPKLPNIEDHLGRAATAKHAAYFAERAGDLDTAWRLHHERRTHYLRHANQQGFSKAQTLALDAEVSEDLANILRKEGRHLDAFIEILYWTTAQRKRPTKRHSSKLRTYFERSDISSVSLEEVTAFVSGARSVSYQSIRSAVSAWSER